MGIHNVFPWRRWKGPPQGYFQLVLIRFSTSVNSLARFLVHLIKIALLLPPLEGASPRLLPTGVDAVLDLGNFPGPLSWFICQRFLCPCPTASPSGWHSVQDAPGPNGVFPLSPAL